MEDQDEARITQLAERLEQVILTAWEQLDPAGYQSPTGVTDTYQGADAIARFVFAHSDEFSIANMLTQHPHP